MHFITFWSYTKELRIVINEFITELGKLGKVTNVCLLLFSCHPPLHQILAKWIYYNRTTNTWGTPTNRNTICKIPTKSFSTENMKWSPEDSQEAYTHCCHFGWGGVHQYVHQYAFPIAFRSFIHFWFISCIVMIHTFLLKSLRLMGSLLRIPRRILFSSSGLLRIPRRPAGLMKRSAAASSSGQLVVNSQQWNPYWDRVQSRKYETRK